jgi:DNA-formamidopyrimidine glycosylase
MPELPEVETIRLALEPHVVGRRFERVEINDSRLVRPFEPMAVAAELEGERVAALDRRGKYLIVRFESDRVLLIHLRMTGSLRHAAGGALGEDPHRRAVVNLDDGSDVAYRDVRRFGTWHLLEPDEVEAYLEQRLGGEPLERSFTASRLAERLAGRQAPIKAALLDQRTVAGLGNIYVDEALWRAQVHPRSRRARAPHEGDPRGAPRRDRTPGREPARLLDPRRSPRPRTGALSCLRPRRRALPTVRNPDRQNPRGRPRHVVLPLLPAPGPRNPHLAAFGGSGAYLGEPRDGFRGERCGVGAAARPREASWGTVRYGRQPVCA